MKDAGITRIGHLPITHCHADHLGGLPELVKRVPIGEFLDRGPNREDSDITRRDHAACLQAIRGKPQRIIQPGDTLLYLYLGHASRHGSVQLAYHRRCDSPRVAIMINGAHKAGMPQAWQTVYDSPGLEDLWMLHTAEGSDVAHNSPEPLIANPRGTTTDSAYFKVVASRRGSFSVTNTRPGQSKKYPRK
jgi:hypothetical protein